MKVVSLVDLRQNISRIMSSLSKVGRVEVTQRNIPVAVILPYKTVSQHHTKLRAGLNSEQILGVLTEPLVPENSWEMLKF